ncbi:thioesterase [Staphylotrichum tortipilum]|uniref:Thioesterase n=1 Tax=Staphylotrichum tortipilum TaxID=2831512 RepID=A0AAN6MKP1_9PEZI|nr:thioesterase [Staphylotrichum longicolle]
MRVFLVQTAHGLSAPPGGYRSNLGFLRQLRSYSHAVAKSCYVFDEEIDESAAKAKAKGIDPEIQHLPGLDLGRNPQTGLERYVPVTKFIDEDGIHNLIISRTTHLLQRDNYALKHGDLPTTFFVYSTWTYLDGGRIPMRRTNVERTKIGLVNACALKGLPTFVELAKRLPHIQIESETTNTERDIWNRAKVLLIPSLRGIPVVASNAGGLPEAKIGLPYCIPVKTVTGEVDPETGDYIVSKQDLAPWEDAVTKLMARDTAHYEEQSDYTARRAVQWTRELDQRAQEKWLLGMRWQSSGGPN